MTQDKALCPTCAQPGVPVDRITLKALLDADGLRRGVPAQPRYCGNAECPIVYFDVIAGVTFIETELIVPVYAKHPNDAETPICYCFGISAGAMADRTRARELREAVAAEVQAQHCACEVKNPKGGCCLGDLVRTERESQIDQPPSCCTVT